MGQGDFIFQLPAIHFQVLRQQYVSLQGGNDKIYVAK